MKYVHKVPVKASCCLGDVINNSKSLDPTFAQKIYFLVVEDKRILLLEA